MIGVRYRIYLSSFLFLLIFSSAQMFSQVPLQIYGDNVIRTSNIGLTGRITVTPTHVYISSYNILGRKWLPREELNFHLNAGEEIVDAGAKKNDPEFYLILLNNGTVIVYDIYYDEVADEFKSGNTDDFYKYINGDALYVLTSKSVLVQRDTANKLFAADTTGLNGSTPNSIALDTLLNTYLATSGGLYSQSASSYVWSLINSFPSNNANLVFVDKGNRIFASTNYDVYYSTDGGKTWTTNDQGLLNNVVSKFGQDAFNNIYAIAGGMVFRSDKGTGPWFRIDVPLTGLIQDAVNQYNSPYNDVGGDSVLYLATKYGLFKSTDKGNTWSADNQGITANTLYGFAKSSGRNFITTNLGLFYQNSSDTVWTKSFPVNGYKTGSAIFTDNNGNLFTLGAQTDNTNYASLQTNWKSADNGTTWIPDTMGLGAIGQGQISNYFVDENGIQHYALSNIQSGVYVKAPNSPWTADTAGLGNYLSSMYPNVIASDYHGHLYAAFTNTSTYAGLLFKRPINGGTWLPDNNGLNGAIIYSMSSGLNGNLYAGTWGGGLYKNSGGAWSTVNMPNGMPTNSSVFVTAASKSGALYAGFSTQDTNYNYLWHGVYYTTDGGNSWTYAGLDSISVRQLIAYGDSIYAVTYNNGLYIFPPNNATKVNYENTATIYSYKLEQNYPNPFNPTTAISYQLSAVSNVTLKVYDILGREVATLVDGRENAGKYSVTFDGSRFASGVYFYRLDANGNVFTKKLILIK